MDEAIQRDITAELESNPSVFGNTSYRIVSPREGSEHSRREVLISGQSPRAIANVAAWHFVTSMTLSLIQQYILALQSHIGVEPLSPRDIPFVQTWVDGSVTLPLYGEMSDFRVPARQPPIDQVPTDLRFSIIGSQFRQSSMVRIHFVPNDLDRLFYRLMTLIRRGQFLGQNWKYPLLP